MSGGYKTPRSGIQGLANDFTAIKRRLSELERPNSATNSIGTKLIIPSSVSVGSGSATVSSKGKISFSGASSVSLNTVFSSNYDVYTIYFYSSANSLVTASLRSGTTNATGANYDETRLIVAGGTTVTGSTTIGNTSWSVNSSTRDYTFSVISLLNPYASSFTFGNVRFTENASTITTTSGVSGSIGWEHSLTTSYDGITFTGASNITGTIYVYGESIV